jgi:hypothetical protein
MADALHVRSSKLSSKMQFSRTLSCIFSKFGIDTQSLRDIIEIFKKEVVNLRHLLDVLNKKLIRKDIWEK